MDAIAAIRDGGLANNPKFFGSTLAEIVARSASNNSSWNGDYAYSVATPNSRFWFAMGNRSFNSSQVGVFAFYGSNSGGGAAEHHSHRTILLGY
ncbi:hypothetical protein FWG76_02530 [Candidatus Saccharibacteria bacterium]|nr:hypothetical protein [Candidatus Saccharibacteria bacterium]